MYLKVICCINFFQVLRRSMISFLKNFFFPFMKLLTFCFEDRGIGESCVISNQCIGVTVNSTCNETTWVCQCKAGHLYLSESNTCSPGKEQSWQPMYSFGIV